ncbi:MAG: DUF3892 domain-containing protein [Cyclobacteriaceae bacterium]
MATNRRDYSAVLETIRCIDEADGIGKGEPYLWTISVRIGGDDIRQSPDDPFRLIGAPHYYFGAGSHNNIGGGMDAGDTRNIPGPVGTFGSAICPIELSVLGNTIQIPGVMGLIVILMEEDNVSDSGAEAGHQALNDLVVSRVNGFLNGINLLEIYTEVSSLISGTDKTIEQGAVEVLKSKFNDLKEQLVNDGQSVIKNAIKNEQNIFENLWSWINADDFVGAEMFLQTTDELLANGKQIDIEGRFNDGDGDYEIKGRFTLSSVKIPVGELPPGTDRLRVESIATAYSYHHNVDYITYVGGSVNGFPWILHKYTGASLIRNGAMSFYVQAEDGSETAILAANHPDSGSLYMRTTPNDTTEDNLLSLPPLAFYLND